VSQVKRIYSVETLRIRDAGSQTEKIFPLETLDSCVIDEVLERIGKAMNTCCIVYKASKCMIRLAIRKAEYQSQ